MTSPILTPCDLESHPSYLSPGYRSSILRSASLPLVPLKENLKNRRVTMYGPDDLGVLDADLTRNATRNGEPLGERIIVTGRVLDEGGRPVRNTLVEFWEANAAGRYVHKADQHDAPLDPNFLGTGRCLTDDQGHYRFMTIKPGAYPCGNHTNAWRPNHIHFSLFGDYFGSRLVTQMYFPGDPLLDLDPIFQGIPEHARECLVSKFSIDTTQENYALGYEFDIVLLGPDQTPTE
ncbi:Protocatechuate 3,4-dioxygenase beta chain [Candidatus Paraburkholderia calva]|nr:Protocatechuate 3,4-dioxygenase beta chain [Candidatus Paraburkholderia calva]